MSINRVNISGNLTRDPELRATASGMPVLSFGVAVNDRRKNNATGQWEDYPNFIDCTMFGARAEAIHRFIGKGAKVAIEGKLRYSTWEKDGQKRSKIEVIVDEIEFMSQRNETMNAPATPQPVYPNYTATAQPVQPQPQPQPIQQPVQQAMPIPQQPQVVNPVSVYEEDIPF